MTLKQDTEIWLPVPVEGYEAHYEVSSLGRIRRLSTITRKGGYGRVMAGRFLKPSPNCRNHYLYVSLKNGVARKAMSLHRLVMLAFNPIDDYSLQVCHQNGDRQDNRLQNLRWDTKLNNQRDTIIHGTSTRGEKNPQAKLTEQDVLKIRALLEDNVCQLKIAALFGVTRSNIYCIHTGKSWSHVGHPNNPANADTPPNACDANEGR